MNSTNYFDNLIELTGKVKNISEPEKIKDWDDLYRIWYPHRSYVNNKIFLGAYKYLLYGKSSDSPLQRLYQGLGEALVNCDEALIHYQTKYKFNLEMSAIGKNKSKLHHQFLVSLLEKKLYYSRSAAGTIAQPCPVHITNFITHYKTFICSLLPEAAQWSENDWIDFKKLKTAMNRSYRVGYYSTSDALDFLHDWLLSGKDSPSTPLTSQCIVLEKNLSFELLPILFKSNSDQRLVSIIDMCWRAGKLNTGPFNTNFKKNWAYPILQKYAEDINHPCYHSAKKLVFNIEMCT